MSFAEGYLDTHAQHDTGIVEKFLVIYIGHRRFRRYIQYKLFAILGLASPNTHVNYWWRRRDEVARFILRIQVFKISIVSGSERCSKWEILQDVGKQRLGLRGRRARSCIIHKRPVLYASTSTSKR